MENWLRSGSLIRKERDDMLHLGSAEATCESDINPFMPNVPLFER